MGMMLHLSTNLRRITQLRLRHAGHALTRFRWPILGIALAGASIAFVLGWQLGPVYRASAIVQLAAGSGDSAAAIEPWQLEQQLEVLNSPGLAAGVISKLGLSDNAGFRADARGIFTGLRGVFNLGPEWPRANPLQVSADIYAHNLHIAAVNPRGYVRIQYASASPELAATIANAHADEFLAYQEASANQLMMRLEAMREALFAADQRLQSLRNGLRPAEISGQQANSAADLGVLEQQLAQVRSELAAAKAVYRDVYQGLGKPRADLDAVPAIFDDPGVQARALEKQKAAEHFEILVAEKGDQHWEAQLAKGNEQAAEFNWVQEMLSAADRIRDNYEALVAQEVDLRQAVENYQEDRERRQALAGLQRDVAAKRAAYYAFYAVVSDALPALATDAVGGRVASRAVAPAESTGVPGVLMAGITFVITLVLGVVVVALLALSGTRAWVALQPGFREAAIACRQCGWQGTGAALELPAVELSGEPVTYACPDCFAAVAVHDVLSDREVLEEIECSRQKPAVLIWNIRF